MSAARWPRAQGGAPNLSSSTVPATKESSNKHNRVTLSSTHVRSTGACVLHCLQQTLRLPMHFAQAGPPLAAAHWKIESLHSPPPTSSAFIFPGPLIRCRRTRTRSMAPPGSQAYRPEARTRLGSCRRRCCCSAGGCRSG
jgi:hypothetical protein